MLSKPSAPQAQLYGTLSLVLTPSLNSAHILTRSLKLWIAFPVSFSSAVWPFCWFEITPPPSETFEQLRQHMVNPASQKLLKSLVKVLHGGGGGQDWTMTESLWQADRVLSHNNKTISTEDAMYIVRWWIHNQKPHLFFKENIVLELFHSSQNILHMNARYCQFSRQNLTCTVKHSEICWITDADSLWYRWQTFWYDEYEMNMNDGM